MTHGRFEIVRHFLLAVKRRLVYAYRIVLTGNPAIVTTQRAVYKVVVWPRAIRQLSREVECARQALTWELFDTHVIEQKLLAPFIAVSTRYRSDGSVEHRTGLMIDFLTPRLRAISDFPHDRAATILSRYCADLGITGRSREVTFERLRHHLTSAAFDFHIPVTAMHGDFTPENALIHGGKLLLLDWEFASGHGSLLYDAWFLRRVILNDVRRGDRALLAKEAAYLVLLEDAVSGIALVPEQLDAFGLATLSLIEFSRIENRGKSTRYLGELISKMDRLLASPPAPQAHDDTAAPPGY